MSDYRLQSEINLQLAFTSIIPLRLSFLLMLKDRSKKGDHLLRKNTRRATCYL